MERICENCKHFCIDRAAAATFCMGQKNMPIVRPFDACKDWKSAYRTNGDAIRHMSDEELADYAYKVLANYCCPPERAHSIKTCTDIAICDECWLNWLKQKVKDEEASF